MPQFVFLYSEVIPTILSLLGVYFIGSGVLDHKNEFLIAGVVLFMLAVLVPFVILTSII
jgi:hypothetical protein